jgi:hypothetical protein
MKRVAHGHEDGQPFRKDDDYRLAHLCKACRAQPGQECTGRMTARFHQPRQDAGMRHGRLDYGKAPWPEDRIKGECYSTLPGCE